MARSFSFICALAATLGASSAGAQPAPAPAPPPAPAAPAPFPAAAPAPFPAAAPVADPAAPAAAPWYPPPPGTWVPTYEPPPGWAQGPENAAPRPPPPPRVLYSQKLVYLGITGTVAGVAILSAGAALVAFAKDRIDLYCDGPFLCGHLDEPGLKNAGIGLMWAGGVLAAAGVPLWILGARRLPPKKDERAPSPPKPALALPEVRVGAASASLRWQF